MSDIIQNLKDSFGSYGFSSWQALVSLLFVVVVIVIIAKYRKDIFELSTRSIVAVGIGAALYAAISFIAIPIGPNTSFRIAIALLTIFGALFGPVVGFLVGFIGHALNDAMAWGSVWWSWVFLSAILGLFAGFVKVDKKFNPLKGLLEKKHIVQMYLFAFMSIFAASLVAYAGDVFLYGEPAGKVWLQIIIASFSNFGVIAVVGIPAVIVLANMNKSKQNLVEEE
ncbi:MAG: ECF-type riboflavin transporter substrate-binding protein [Clostridia bacterium]|nr:ECF-type riboflavin transporter substrate-binding protein [Clostridia bacterium]